jgi:tetratricopeptide (TPR) repeat protein
MIVNRVARKIPEAEHFDLLHSARRLYRRRLADCTLTNIEREIFGFYREDDIPGYLIPSVYFDWLQTDNLEAMQPVLEHNRLDILALYFLLLQIDTVFREDGATLDSVEDVYSLSRVYGRRKQNDKVAANYRALTEMSRRPLDHEMMLYHAMALKRTGDWVGAADIWQELAAGENREAFLASLEMAKYFEHQTGDLEQALEYTRLAAELAGRDRRHKAALAHRRARLRRKMKR